MSALISDFSRTECHFQLMLTADIMADCYIRGAEGTCSIKELSVYYDAESDIQWMIVPYLRAGWVLAWAAGCVLINGWQICLFWLHIGVNAQNICLSECLCESEAVSTPLSVLVKNDRLSIGWIMGNMFQEVVATSQRNIQTGFNFRAKWEHEWVQRWMLLRCLFLQWSRAVTFYKNQNQSEDTWNTVISTYTKYYRHGFSMIACFGVK